MAATYEPIASTTLASDSASLTLSSIPATYTDLRLVLTGAAAAGNAICLQLNSDTSTNYSWTLMYGDGSGAYSLRGSNDSHARVGSISTGGPHLAVADLMNYANTNVYKTIISNSVRDANGPYRVVALWRDTSAISSITVKTLSPNLLAGFTASLFGVKAA